VKNASGGPAGGQTFEKFDEQVFKVDFDSFEGVGFPIGFDLTSKHLLLPLSSNGAERQKEIQPESFWSSLQKGIRRWHS